MKKHGKLVAALSRLAPDLSIQFAVGAVGLVLLAGIGTQVYDRLESLRTTPRVYAKNSAFELTAGFLELKSAWSQARTGTAADANAFEVQFEAFAQQMRLLLQARLPVSLHKNSTVRRNLQRLNRQLGKGRQLFQTKAYLTPSGQQRIQVWLMRMEPNVKGLYEQMLREFSAASEAERQELQTLLISLAALLTFMGLMLMSSMLNMSRKAQMLRMQSRNLKEGQEQLRATVASALDAVIVADKDDQVIDWNEPASEMFGIERDDALGRKVADMIVPRDMRQAHRDGIAMLLESGNTSAIGRRREVSALHACGSEFPIELTVGMAETRKGPIFISFIRDISARREKQEELRISAQRAQAGEKAKSAFLAVMSHEMRTPLNGILGTMELMCDTPLNERQKKLVETANNSGELLLDLINDVLDLSKLDAGKIQLRKERFSLTSMFEQLGEMLAPALAESSNSLRVSVDEEIPDYIESDPGRLRQVIINLLSNATKFTKDGAISVDCQLNGPENEDGKALLQFSVSDTGIGIAKERLGDLFKDFAQIDPSFRRRQGGTGLGLAITKRTVTAMGGEVGVSSSEGHGSTFWFTLPVKLCAESQAGPATKSTADGRYEAPKDTPLSGTVLVAEDNFTNAMVASDMLESAGLKVVHAKNGQEAADRARAGGFDLVLMDISMPEMDGIEATMLIRADEKAANKKPVPILALTANAMPEEVERFYKAGMDGCLTKPIRKQILLDALRDNLFQNTSANEGGQSPEEEHVVHELPVVDMQVLDELESKTSGKLVTRVIDQYLVEAAQNLQLAVAAAEQGDMDGLRKTTHALSGSSSTVGALKLQELVASIEKACIHGDEDHALERAMELEETGRKTCDRFGELAKQRAA